MFKRRKSFLACTKGHRRKLANRLAENLLQPGGVDAEEVVEHVLREDMNSSGVSDTPELSSGGSISDCCEGALMQKLDLVLKRMDDMEKIVTNLTNRFTDFEKSVGELEHVKAGIKSIAAKVLYLEECQKEFLKTVLESRISSTDNMQSRILPFLLPISDWDHFCEVMMKVEDMEVKELLVQNLGRIGGRDVTAITNAILSRMLFKSFAEHCSWKGQRGEKHALDNTPLLQIVHGAVIRNLGHEKTTEEAVKGKLQTWLKTASQRKDTGDN